MYTVAGGGKTYPNEVGGCARDGWIKGRNKKSRSHGGDDVVDDDNDDDDDDDDEEVRPPFPRDSDAGGGRIGYGGRGCGGGGG